MNTYHVAVGWKYGKKSTITWEKSFSVEANGRKEAAVLAGVALARTSIARRASMQVQYVKITKIKGDE